YKIDGELTDDFPFATILSKAEPVIEYLDGWKEDISKVRKFEDLPKACQEYVLYVEKQIGTHIGYVSVGAERDAIIIR
ncbi:MAG: adenylosuccinate synthetase, partial [Erysipelotrichaceae bacterium]